MGNHPTQELNESGTFLCLVHSNLTICSPLSPFCSQTFPTFTPSYWGAHSYTPEGQLSEKGILPTRAGNCEDFLYRKIFQKIPGKKVLPENSGKTTYADFKSQKCHFLSEQALPKLCLSMISIHKSISIKNEYH